MATSQPLEPEAEQNHPIILLVSGMKTSAHRNSQQQTQTLGIAESGLFWLSLGVEVRRRKREGSGPLVFCVLTKQNKKESFKIFFLQKQKSKEMKYFSFSFSSEAKKRPI